MGTSDNRITRLVAALAVSPAGTRQARRDAAFARGDFRVCQPWHDGPADGAERVLLSVNEYRPHSVRDVVGIGRAAGELIRAEVLANSGAVGIMSAFGPRRRILYSLSVWRSEEALKEFTIAPAHREIMRQYRARGYLRHLHWWGEHRSIGTSMLEATQRLDRGEGRRVGDARDPWARADQARLATLGTTPAAPVWRSARRAGKEN